MKEISYDVAVIGGGPGGICAGIAAAKCGAKTVIIEKSAVLGGMSTGGMVNVWCGRTEHGFFRDIRDNENVKRKRRNVFDPERLKTYYIEKVTEAGCDIILHCTFVDAVCEGGKVRSVICMGNGEKLKVCAKEFIDATGDGILAYSLGCEYTLGRGSDNLCEPLTLMFMIGGVEDGAAVYPTFGTNPELEEKMAQYVKDGKISEPCGHVILVEGREKGVAIVNMTNIIKTDATDIFELTNAELTARKQIPQIVKFLKECVPGYENCYLLNTAEYIGIRETRHLKCDYCFNENDIIEGKVFDDWAVFGAVHSFGAHNLTGSGKDESQSVNLSYDGRPYTIPLGSLILSGFSNLLAAGRCISGTHLAHTSYRTMPICMATGDGAGVAAALAARDNCDVRNIDIDEFHDLLINKLSVKIN